MRQSLDTVRSSSSTPDFLIIGAAKAGTTTLFNWLGEQPEISLPKVKEPAFFSDDRMWMRGAEWYAALFPELEKGQRTGEASTAYTDPRHAGTAAERIAHTLPDVKLIYLVRHPIERLRSHYRHQVQRGRERASLAQAVARPDNPYVGHSLYFTCLRPYLERFDTEQIAVLRTEDVVDGGVSWLGALGHIGLEPRRAPDRIYNVTATKEGYRAPLRWLWERGWAETANRLPTPARRLGRKLLMRRDATYIARLEGSGSDVPSDVEAKIWADVERLDTYLGPGPRWTRDAG